ncbi:MFS transporter [Streptomyces gossypii]|nr:MFS transporter [Streptomyces gossypii]
MTTAHTAHSPGAGGNERDGPPPDRPTVRRQRTVLMLMCACVLVLQSLVAAINLAIAEISAGDLRPSSPELLWIVDAYVIVFACLLIPAGMLGDRFGRKGMLLTGIGVFGAGALMSALATGVPVLIAGRGISGAGAALAMPASMSVLVQVMPAERRASAIASWSASVAIGGVVGNAGGALILQAFPWQGLFWAYVPASVLLLAVTAMVAPRLPHGTGALDVPGAVLLTCGLVPLLFGIIEGPELGWSSGVVLGAFGVSALVLTLFTLYELRARVVLLDPRLFRLPAVRAGTIGVGAVFFAMFTLFFVNAQFLQYVKDYSPLRTGFAIVPMAVGMVIVTQISVRWARRYGERRVVGTGLMLLVAGLLLMSTATRDTPYTLYTTWLMVMAVGAGLAMPSLSSGILGALPPQHAGMGSGLNGAARELGAALGIAGIGTVLNIRFTDQLPEALAGDAHSTSAALAAAAEEGEALHLAAVESFTRAVATGYQTAAAVLLLLCVPVLFGRREGR